MIIGIVGGTGGMGKGFSLRWCTNHDIIIGSRDAARARKAAAEYTVLAREAHGGVDRIGDGTGGGRGGSITGDENASVARDSDVLILSIGYENIDSTCSELLPLIGDECVVVSPIVPMTRTDAGFEFIPIKEGRPFSYQLVAKYMKDRENLVSAFHVISEKKLADPGLDLDYDIFVCGDGDRAVGVVDGLIKEIRGLRPIHLGPGSLSYMAEIATPLLLNAMIKNKIRNPGIKIV